MSISKRLNLAAVVLVIGVIAIVMLATVASAQADASIASLSLSTEPITQTTSLDNPPSLGEPCGCGEQLPPWVVCLHGTISLVQPTGQAMPLDGIPIAITLGDQVVTGTTFIHPGYVTPTYGIDISPLELTFLQPVTLTAVVSGVVVERQVVVFPDFRIQSQRFDVQIADVGALDPAPLWGYVVDFGAGGPVAGALVTAEYGGQRVAVTTTAVVSEPFPIYALSAMDLMAIGATPGDVVTLTAHYGDDADQQVVALGYEPLQVNLVTGWKCDDFDPLPRTSGGDGLPRTSGGDGLPDVACFWGYGVVDGRPRAGVAMQVAISNTVYQGQTRFYPGEVLPRYGIGMWDWDTINGQELAVTGVYSGNADTESITTSLNADLHQRVDVALTSAQALSGGPYRPWVNEVVIAPGYSITNGVVFASSSGLFRSQDGGQTWLSVPLGSWSEDTSSLAVALGPSYTVTEGIVFVGHRNILRSVDGGLNWTTVHSLPLSYEGKSVSVVTLGVAPGFTLANGIAFAGTSSYGILRSTDGGQTWEQVNDGLTDWSKNTVRTIVVMPGCSSESGTVFARMNELFRSDDGGQSWTQIVVPGMSNRQGGSLAIASGSTVSETTVFVGSSNDGGLWRSNDGGGTWDLLNITSTLAFDHIVLADGYTTSEGLVLVDANGDGLWYSEDGGDTWSTIPIASWSDPNVIGMTIAPGFNMNDGVIFASNTMDGLLRSIDSGQTWTPVNTGFLGTHVTSLSAMYNPITRRHLLIAGIQHAGIFRSTDSGMSWKVANTGVPNPAGNYLYSILIMPGSTFSNSVVIGGHQNIILRSVDGGQSWTQVYDQGANDLALASGSTITESVVLAAGGNGGLLRSTDGGVTWATVSAFPLVSISSIATAPAEHMSDTVVFVGRAPGLVHRSLDGGQTWITTSLDVQVPVTQNVFVNDLVILPGYDSNSGVVFAATNFGIHCSTDGGITWHPVSEVLSDTWISTMAIAPRVPVSRSILWAGKRASLDHGTIRSLDGGQTWEQVNLEPPCGWVSSIVLSDNYTNDHLVFVGCYLQGVYALYDTDFSDVAIEINTSLHVSSGSLLTYTLHYANRGGVRADETYLNLNLPDDTNLVSSSQAPVTVNPLIWQLGTLNPGVAAAITVTVQVSPTVVPGTNLEALAVISTASLEDYQENNTATAYTTVSDPYQSDVRANLVAPPILIPDSQARYLVTYDNAGSLPATTSILSITLPVGLSYHSATLLPVSLAPLVWDLGTLPAQSLPSTVAVTLTVASTVPPDVDLVVSAFITTTTSDSDLTNNTAVVTTSIKLGDARTLILVAPNRLVNRYGASPLISTLYELADHPLVQGVVLDVTRDPAVQAAYAAWDADPGDWQKANAVATAIKALVDQYTITYPNLRYLVLVGGDDIIPHYRVADQNATHWHERNYRPHVPPGTVHAALAADRLLTDDFYADRSPTVPDSVFWTDGHPLYLPDLATGRLVETPTEMIAAVEAFLANDGAIALGPGLVGTQSQLTDDLGQTQCVALGDDGLVVSCTESPSDFQVRFLSQPSGSAWAALHSNHFSIGTLNTTAILNRIQPYSQTLLATIGCHAGLNVPAGPGPQWDLDLAQVLLGRGGTTIGPTAYAYASRFGMGYSEDLALGLMHQLLVTTTQEIGPALVRTKQVYYADHGWFDYTDEKVLLPVTLYGLPMLRVTTPDSLRGTSVRRAPAAQSTMVQLDDLTVVTYTFDKMF